MRVAIVHYHLGPGGVSRMIAAGSKALGEGGVDHVILTGNAPERADDSLPVELVEGLGYGGNIGVDELRAAALRALGAAPDIWHFHNHSLGKNRSLTDAVAKLAAEHERVVLHLHDLTEDGRPGLYPVIADAARLYPVAERVKYVFLNGRDRRIFVEAGLPEDHSMVLANGIEPSATKKRPDACGPTIVFAPVRGIRRKNIGELVFLSALAPDGCRFAVSRAPMDPAARAIHDRWERFAKRQRLPIAFDVTGRCEPAAGAGADFETWVEHASHIVTTSVAEGFGLPFLEAAAWGKPLLGRNLPHITAEHRDHGILTGDLYDAILIPLEWVDISILKDHLKTTLERNRRAYGVPPDGTMMSATFDALVQEGWLDFGNLPESLQQGVIERLQDPAGRDVPPVRIEGRSRSARGWLLDALANRHGSVTEDQLAPYSMARYRDSLLEIYQDLMTRPADEVRCLDRRNILSAFLNPGSFHFLCSTMPPDEASWKRHRAVIFDVYGTLLIAPPGGVKPEPEADPVLRKVLAGHGYEAPDSPSTALHEAVLRHHAASEEAYPEVDLRVLWREILGLEEGLDVSGLVEALEAVWHPARLMPGAEQMIPRLSPRGISLGLLSNAQCHTLSTLGGAAELLAPELTILSFQHGIAKPSARLFEMLVDRLAGRGITPEETLYIGNDPLHDIVPAAAAGFRTVLFQGHPDSLRPGDCMPDLIIRHWSELSAAESKYARRIANEA